jgi:hypothetical protein
MQQVERRHERGCGDHRGQSPPVVGRGRQLVGEQCGARHDERVGIQHVDRKPGSVIEAQANETAAGGELHVGPDGAMELVGPGERDGDHRQHAQRSRGLPAEGRRTARIGEGEGEPGRCQQGDTRILQLGGQHLFRQAGNQGAEQLTEGPQKHAPAQDEQCGSPRRRGPASDLPRCVEAEQHRGEGRQRPQRELHGAALLRPVRAGPRPGRPDPSRTGPR